VGRGQLQVLCLAVILLAAPAQTFRFQSPRNASYVVPGVPATISISIEPELFQDEIGSGDQLLVYAVIIRLTINPPPGVEAVLPVHTPPTTHTFPVAMADGRVLIALDPMREDLAIAVGATLMRQSDYHGLIAGRDGGALLWYGPPHPGWPRPW